MEFLIRYLLLVPAFYAGILAGILVGGFGCWFLLGKPLLEARKKLLGQFDKVLSDFSAQFKSTRSS